MLVLSRSDLEALLPLEACIEEMRRAMIATSRRECELPLRQFMPVPGHPGKFGLMPGYLGPEQRGGADCFGVKIVSKYERAQGDARRLALLGTGEEARWHARALLAVRSFTTLVVWGRSQERAAALIAGLRAPRSLETRVAASAEEAVRGSDVVCTLTSAKEPFVRGEWLAPGMHLNLVGSAIPTTAEVDSACVARGRFYVDFLPAARVQAGELQRAIAAGAVTPDHVAGEIGEVLRGRKPGRDSDAQITIYKSLGVTTQDLAAAQRAWREAQARGIGREIRLEA